MTYCHHRGLLVHVDFVERLRAAGIDSYEALMAAEGVADLHKEGLGGWRQRLRLEIGEETFYLKRYRRPPLREQVGQRVRGFAATAAVEWQRLQELWAVGVVAPVPVAVGWRRRGGVEVSSLLLCTAVAGEAMERWVDERGGALREAAFRRRLVTDVGRLAGRLHCAGLFHRDLYLSHIFLEVGPDRTPQLAVIDLQRAVRPRLRRWRWAVKDLAALDYSTPAFAATRADRLRGFKAYRGCARLCRRDRRTIRAVRRKARRMARHDARR